LIETLSIHLFARKKNRDLVIPQVFANLLVDRKFAKSDVCHKMRQEMPFGRHKTRSSQMHGIA